MIKVFKKVAGAVVATAMAVGMFGGVVTAKAAEDHYHYFVQGDWISTEQAG